MTNNFTNQGYVKRTASEVKTDLANWMTANSAGYTQQTADIQNNILDTFTPCIMEVENLVADFANGYAPGYANNFMWEILAQNNGLTYKDEARASVTLLFRGKAGTFIPINTKLTGNFVTNNSIVLGTTGEGYVTATSNDEVEFNANEITEILSSVPEGVTVTNPTSSSPYKAEQTAEELKLNAQRKFRNALICNEDYCTMRLLELKGTDARLINYRITGNDTRNTIECVIGGGDVAEVANVLFNSFVKPSDFNSQPSDNDTQRTVSYEVLFYSGKFPIKWTLPKELKLKIKLILQLSGSDISQDTFQQYLNEKIGNEINTRQLGTPLNRATLNKIVYDGILYHNTKMENVSTLNWQITDEKDTTLTFDTNDFLSGIAFDVYTTLENFTLEMMILG